LHGCETESHGIRHGKPPATETGPFRKELTMIEFDFHGKDPVCGMEVQPEDAADTYQFEGKTIYFCSTTCKNEFEQHPRKYALKKVA
jgi:P-type Cu+ transporter